MSPPQTSPVRTTEERILQTRFLVTSVSSVVQILLFHAAQLLPTQLPRRSEPHLPPQRRLRDVERPADLLFRRLVAAVLRNAVCNSCSRLSTSRYKPSSCRVAAAQLHFSASRRASRRIARGARRRSSPSNGRDRALLIAVLRRDGRSLRRARCRECLLHWQPPPRSPRPWLPAQPVPKSRFATP